ncbi:MAG: hypothetical protein DRJ05_18205, partial [Bacteroidetes bacterium]
IGGKLEISENDSLISLSGLENINSIGGDLEINGNNLLESLTGLNNIEPNSISSLQIINNDTLSSCAVESICDYLASPNGSIYIHDNDTGCNSQSEVEDDCGFNSCLAEGITFTTQSQIFNFQTIYPGCSEIEGDVEIIGNNITNLDGLNPILSIGGELWIHNSPMLDDLSGLSSLESIGGDLTLTNLPIQNFTGLDALETVGGEVDIVNLPDLTSMGGLGSLFSTGASFAVNNCPLLSNMQGLNSLSTIEGMFWLLQNDALNSLTGLESLNYIGNGINFSHLELINLNGLDNLTFVGGSIIIQNQNNFINFEGLNSLNQYNGWLIVFNNDVQVNMAGLEFVNSLAQLQIKSCPNFSDFSGLDNLINIEGYLNIWNNQSLNNLSGLDALTSVGGYFEIGSNDALTTLNGINNLNAVGGNLWIDNNFALTSLSGLENLTTIGLDLQIDNNIDLVNIEALSNLTMVGGNLKINQNELISLNGIDNIEPNSITNLIITGNNFLSDCHVQSICDYLVNPNGTITIQNNAPGCNSPEEVEEACEPSSSCLPDGITFTDQQQIDDFQTDYPGCTEIEGDVEINGSDITNLNGLNVVTAISGELLIENNSSLLDLTGLENLASIGWDLVIGSGYQDYQALTSLSGLDNLTSIGGSLFINKNDDLTDLFTSNNLVSINELYIRNNNMLTGLTSLSGISGGVINLEILNNASLLSLEGLDNITSVGYIAAIRDNNALSSIENLVNLQSTEWLYITNNPILMDLLGLENLTSAYALSISDNDALTSLSGLENVDPGSLCNLNIFDNNTLSTCHVQSICDYLVSPTGWTIIHDNAPGCNTEAEVYDACWSKTDETLAIENNIQIFPNPAKNMITILNSSKAEINEIIIYSPSGKTILQKKNPVNTIDISGLQAGLYFVEVKTEMGDVRRKLIVE